MAGDVCPEWSALFGMWQEAPGDNQRNEELSVRQFLSFYMHDGTMFHNLTKYQDPEFCQTNGDVVFHTRDSNRYFRPVAVMRISESEAREFPYHTVTVLTESTEYDAFFTRCAYYADWMAEERPAYPAMLLTLSTCEYSKENSRLVVVCACSGMETASAPQSEDAGPELTQERKESQG